MNTFIIALVDRTLLIAGVRLGFSVFLAVVQLYVLRAFLRIIRSMGLGRKKERFLVAAAVALIVTLNVPLAIFAVEGVFTPRGLLLYSPVPEYESLMRPVAYAFFIWNLGSLFFAVAAPAAMALFAAAQFFRRGPNDQAGGAGVGAFDLSRRRFLQMALLAAASMPFAIPAYGAVAARSRKVVERVTVPITGLPPQLDGLTIAQMSDIHAGLFMRESQVREYAEIANSLGPDVVALTGDFVATKSSQVEPFIKAISTLKAKYGVYGILGNHDLFSNSDELIESGFARHGFKLLRGANEVIDIGGAKLNIIGVDYIGFNSKIRSVDDALRGIPTDGTTVLLLHSPQLFPQAAKAGIHLTLSGHTHGGQIALSFGDLILAPARLSTMFIAGLFKIGNSHLYVNRGLGTTGPPIRIGAPPEITLITLKAV
ncbi:MAG TPA: metallophosphoesterase [Blastocatellia bacterium]|nr:metallophosphoesterase [Blastocatellia bacterium]